MIPVKTMPRFKCDFCRKRGTKASMNAHERICWKNPNRFCDNCENTGVTLEDYDLGLRHEIPCHFCSQRDDWPKKKEVVEEKKMSKIIEVPF